VDLKCCSSSRCFYATPRKRWCAHLMCHLQKICVPVFIYLLYSHVMVTPNSSVVGRLFPLSLHETSLPTLGRTTYWRVEVKKGRVGNVFFSGGWSLLVASNGVTQGEALLLWYKGHMVLQVHKDTNPAGNNAKRRNESSVPDVYSFPFHGIGFEFCASNYVHT
jgi:uncharacterized protein (DUF427 family)